jgi:7,8-dihydropterin-6-yl-methyl-4-(beta-D-ribofuranosyl)aminobenzene 5'-phosphate synthase
MTRITILVENTVHRRSLVAEHGLSFHVWKDGTSLLFDTGQTDLSLINAATLGIPLDQIGAVVLSHGHYDHTGGLPAILEFAPAVRVFMHPAAFAAKFRRAGNQSAQPIGMSSPALQAIRQHPSVFETKTFTRIAEDVFVTGEIPRRTDYEDTGGPFFLDSNAAQPDPLVDDQALVIDLGRSLVVLLGCAHAGVVNTLELVRQKTAAKPIRAVIGGLHLGSASEARIERTITKMRELDLEFLAPVHCTGWPASARLWEAFPDSYRPAGVGSVFEFEDSAG